MVKSNFTSYLAHQNGWDEILLVATPLVFVGFLLFFANKKISKKLDNKLPNDPKK